MNIKIFMSDLDGTLSDGIYNMSEDGKLSKNFYTRDFDALRQLSEAGIDIFIITSASDSVIIEKCKCLSFPVEVRIGIIDKKAEMDEILQHHPNVSWDNVACIGDAENDIECIKAAGFSGCPWDAIKEINPNRDIVGLESAIHFANNVGVKNPVPFVPPKRLVDYVSDKPGGRGAVYNFAMEVLRLNDK